MQDGALNHSAISAKKELLEQGMHIIFQPAYSPDLNPIKTVQNWIEDYIKLKYGDIQLSYDQLQYTIQDGQESITKKQLNSSIDSIKERSEAAIVT